MQIDSGLYLFGLAGTVPLLAVWLAAAIVAFVRFDRDPRRSTMVLLAVGIFFLTRIVFPLITPLVLNAVGGGIQEIQLRVLLNALMYSVPGSIAYALLIWAALGLSGDRSRRSGEMAEDAWSTATNRQ